MGEKGVMTTFESRREEFVISTDPARLDLVAVHAYLTRSYWAAGIAREVVEKSVVRIPVRRLRAGGLSRAGTRQMVDERRAVAPDLQHLFRFVLVTRDAHGLYEQFGFSRLRQPDRYMEISR